MTTNGTFMHGKNDYYQKLIHVDNAADPLRRLLEMEACRMSDCGHRNTAGVPEAAPGCLHPFDTTALLAVLDVCGPACGFCRSKRPPHEAEREAVADIGEGLAYIVNHPEIRTVVLTGGDSLTLDAGALRAVIERLRAIPHVRIIRLNTKIPVYDPARVYDNEDWLDVIRAHSCDEKRIYVNLHVHHPRELTAEAMRAIKALREAGAVVLVETPVLKGVNDDPAVLAELLEGLIRAGIRPYRFLVSRPVAGSRADALPLEATYRIVEQAKALISGLARGARLMMAHESGGIEILAIEDGRAYLKYHQAAEGREGKFLMLDCPHDAAWFDELPGSERFWSRTGRREQPADEPQSPMLLGRHHIVHLHRIND